MDGESVSVTEERQPEPAGKKPEKKPAKQVPRRAELATAAGKVQIGDVVLFAPPLNARDLLRQRGVHTDVWPARVRYVWPDGDLSLRIDRPVGPADETRDKVAFDPTGSPNTWRPRT